MSIENIKIVQNILMQDIATIKFDLPVYPQKKKSPLGAYQQVGTFDDIITQNTKEVKS